MKTTVILKEVINWSRKFEDLKPIIKDSPEPVTPLSEDDWRKISSMPGYSFSPRTENK